MKLKIFVYTNSSRFLGNHIKIRLVNVMENYFEA